MVSDIYLVSVVCGFDIWYLPDVCWVWSDGGPVLTVAVAPLFLVQSNWSVLSWVQRQGPEVKSQFNCPCTEIKKKRLPVILYRYSFDKIRKFGIHQFSNGIFRIHVGSILWHLWVALSHEFTSSRRTNFQRVYLVWLRQQWWLAWW